MSNGRIDIDGVCIDMNPDEIREALIMQYAIKKQLEPILEQVTKNTSSIKWLKWIIGGVSFASFSLAVTIITILVT